MFAQRLGWSCGRVLNPTPVERREARTAADAEARRLQADRRKAEAARIPSPAELARMPYRALETWATTPDRLKMAARVRGYRPAWVAHRMREMGQPSRRG